MNDYFKKRNMDDACRRVFSSVNESKTLEVSDFPNDDVVVVDNIVRFEDFARAYTYVICPFCDNAKKQFKTNLNVKPSRYLVDRRLHKYNYIRSNPYQPYDGRYDGGYDDGYCLTYGMNLRGPMDNIITSAFDELLRLVQNGRSNKKQQREFIYITRSKPGQQLIPKIGCMIILNRINGTVIFAHGGDKDIHEKYTGWTNGFANVNSDVHLFNKSGYVVRALKEVSKQVHATDTANEAVEDKRLKFYQDMFPRTKGRYRIISYDPYDESGHFAGGKYDRVYNDWAIAAHISRLMYDDATHPIQVEVKAEDGTVMDYVRK